MLLSDSLFLTTTVSSNSCYILSIKYLTHITGSLQKGIVIIAIVLHVRRLRLEETNITTEYGLPAQVQMLQPQALTTKLT